MFPRAREEDATAAQALLRTAAVPSTPPSAPSLAGQAAPHRSPPRDRCHALTLGRGGENARRVLQAWSGTLVTDDFSGYHVLAKQGVTAALCMAHARRKLFEGHKLNGSETARQAVWVFDTASR